MSGKEPGCSGRRNRVRSEVGTHPAWNESGSRKRRIDKIGDLLTPKEGAAFATITFEGECPADAVETAFIGSMIAEGKPVNEVVLWAELEFPIPAIKKGFRWKGNGAKPEEVTAGLKMFGLSSTLVVTEMVMLT